MTLYPEPTQPGRLAAVAAYLNGRDSDPLPANHPATTPPDQPERGTPCAAPSGSSSSPGHALRVLDLIRRAEAAGGVPDSERVDPRAATQTEMTTGQLIIEDIGADPEQVERLRRSRRQAQGRQLFRRDGTPLASADPRRQQLLDLAADTSGVPGPAYHARAIVICGTTPDTPAGRREWRAALGDLIEAVRAVDALDHGSATTDPAAILGDQWRSVDPKADARDAWVRLQDEALDRLLGGQP